MPYLIDTDWAINSLSGRASASQVIRQAGPGQIGMSSISIGELYEGAYISANPSAHISAFNRFLLPFQILPVTQPIMERFAEVRAYLRRRGDLIGDFDTVIAATALHHDLTLLTLNLRHFQRVPDLRIYPQ